MREKILRCVRYVPYETISHAKNNFNLRMKLSKARKEVMSDGLAENWKEGKLSFKEAE